MGLFSSAEAPSRTRGTALVLCALMGGVPFLFASGATGGPVGGGGAGGVGGFERSVALLAWLTLIAPSCGAFLGAIGVRLWPFGWGVPASWLFFLIWSELLGIGGVVGPAWAAAAIIGLFALGLGLGSFWPGRPAFLAGLIALVMLGLTGLSVQGGFSAESWARARPGLARALLEVSPLVLVMECAGLDWTHSQPDVYRLSGVEWFPRRPYRGPLAGPVVLVVGCSLAFLASRRRGVPPNPTGDHLP